jgi:hypothetical protein
VEYQRGLLMQQFDGQNGVDDDDEPDGNDGLEGDGPRNPDGTEAED